MASKKVAPPPAPTNDEVHSPEPPAPRRSKRPGPVRRNTIDVELSWLEIDAPAPDAGREPVLREEKIVWRKPPSNAGDDPPKRAPAAGRTTGDAGPRPVVVKRAIPREDDPAAPEPPRAARPASRRSKRPTARPIPRDETPESVPPPRRHSKPPRR